MADGQERIPQGHRYLAEEGLDAPQLRAGFAGHVFGAEPGQCRSHRNPCRGDAPAEKSRHFRQAALLIGGCREDEPLRDELTDLRGAEQTEGSAAAERLEFDHAPIMRLFRPRQALASTRVSCVQLAIVDSESSPGYNR
jgi:hypothetical protein